MQVMLYQLPNGKVVHLTIEEFLDLTDEDMQYLMSIDFGEHIRDPFTGLFMNNDATRKEFINLVQAKIH